MSAFISLPSYYDIIWILGLGLIELVHAFVHLFQNELILALVHNSYRLQQELGCSSQEQELTCFSRARIRLCFKRKN